MIVARRRLIHRWNGGSPPHLTVLPRPTFEREAGEAEVGAGARAPAAPGDVAAPVASKDSVAPPLPAADQVATGSAEEDVLARAARKRLYA